MPPCDFVKSSLVLYQWFEMSKRNLKDILSDVDELIKEGYGTYNELINLTYRDIADIQIVRVSKEQEEQINGISK